jgi:hypothetical protein
MSNTASEMAIVVALVDIGITVPLFSICSTELDMSRTAIVKPFCFNYAVNQHLYQCCSGLFPAYIVCFRQSLDHKLLSDRHPGQSL